MNDTQILYNDKDNRIQLRLNTGIRYLHQISEYFQYVIDKVDMKKKY